jgi:hypothetical protein
MIRYIIGLSLFSGLLLFACNKSTIVGSEILDDDFVDVAYTDTFSIKAKTIAGDSARMYPISSSLFLLGNIDDPVFGRSNTEVYTQIRKLFDIPEMSNAVLDSVVLSVSLNSDGLWGDSMALHTVEVYELGESLVDYDSLYTNQQFGKGMLLGSKTFNPFFPDTATVVFNADTARYNNLLRIPLDQSFGEKLLSDTLALQNDTLIQNLTNGLVIRSTASNTSVFGISTFVVPDEFTNKVVLYFTRNGSEKEEHIMTLGGKRSMYVENDRSGTLLESFLDDPQKGDSVLFLSGMLNSYIDLEIPVLDGLENRLINYAELEFTVNNELSGNPYEPIERIYAYNIDENGNRAYIYDLNIAILQSTINYYGGELGEKETVEGNTLERYRINVTNELKRRIDENDTRTTIRLIPYLSTQRANRSIFYGPGNTEYPPRLKITFTQQ